MAVVPAAGVVLVHACDDETARAGCPVCPGVTPELAACYALQALEAAGVEHDPAEVWSAVRQAVDEQLTWRETVASLAAGETAAEPAVRVLERAGVTPARHDGPPAPFVDQPTDRIALDWREHTAPVPPADTTRRGQLEDGSAGPVPVAGGRIGWSRVVVGLAAVAAMLAGATGYVVASRPDWAHMPTGPARVGTADPTQQSEPGVDVDAGGGEQQGGSGGAGPVPGRTATGQPTPTPAPTPGSSPKPTGQTGGRTQVSGPPAASSPAPSRPAESSPAPTGGQAGDPGPSASSSSPAEPEPSDTTPADPEPSPSLEVDGGLVDVTPGA